MLIFPPVPSGTIWNRLTQPSVSACTDATPGRAWPAAHSVIAVSDPVTEAETLSATEDTPVVGTPASPVICSSVDPPATRGPVNPPCPLRVSNTRDGVSGTYVPPALPELEDVT